MVAELALRAVPTVAVDLPGRGRHPGPLGSLEESAAHVRRLVDEIADPVVVVGHSFGGIVISEAISAHANVQQLVYLAALIPDQGESMLSGIPEMMAAPMSQCLEERDSVVYFDAARAGEIFYGDCADETVRWAGARLGQEPRAIFEAPLTQSALRHHPSTYVLCERDNAVPPELQERFAKRCDRTIRWDSDHSPMLSQPDRVVDLLMELCA